MNFLSLGRNFQCGLVGTIFAEKNSNSSDDMLWTCSRAMNILIAEDNQDDVVYITRALEKASIKDTVHFVKDGQEAIEYLHGEGAYVDRQAHPLPWIAILDIQLPCKTGFETLAWMRLRPGYRDIPVMILSSSGLENDIALAYKYGANAYVKKPEDAADLAAELRRFYNFWRPTALHNKAST